MKKLFCVPILCMALLLALGPACPAPAAGNKQLEVFSWWTSGGEAMALEALFKVYKHKNPGVEVLNAAVTGGGGVEDLDARILVLVNFEERLKGHRLSPRGPPGKHFQLLVPGRRSRAGWAERQKQRHAQNGNTEQLLHSGLRLRVVGKSHRSNCVTPTCGPAPVSRESKNRHFEVSASQGPSDHERHGSIPLVSAYVAKRSGINKSGSRVADPPL